MWWSGFARRVGCLGLIAFSAACVPEESQESVVSATGEERAIPERHPRVVSHAEASSSGLRSRRVVREFGARADGAELLEKILAQAEHEHAALVSDIHVVFASDGEQGPLWCESAIVPDKVSEAREIPGGYRSVPIQQPVTRTVPELVNRCHMESHSELQSVTEHEYRCHSISRPVSHTRTTYTTQYDSYSHSSHSVPHTETYTTYENKNECNNEPVQRMRNVSKMKNVCRLETEMRTVTRYEFQFATEYVPPRTEVYERHRLRELEPSCFQRADPAPPAANSAEAETPSAPVASAAPAVAPTPDEPTSNRIEAMFYFE